MAAAKRARKDASAVEFRMRPSPLPLGPTREFIGRVFDRCERLLRGLETCEKDMAYVLRKQKMEPHYGQLRTFPVSADGVFKADKCAQFIPELDELRQDVEEAIVRAEQSEPQLNRAWGWNERISARFFLPWLAFMDDTTIPFDAWCVIMLRTATSVGYVTPSWYASDTMCTFYTSLEPLA
jgi:hypothetical protein